MQSNFKVRVVYEGVDFAAIDDLSIQEAACRPNYFIIENFSERLAVAQAAVEVWVSLNYRLLEKTSSSFSLLKFISRIGPTQSFKKSSQNARYVIMSVSP